MAAERWLWQHFWGSRTGFVRVLGSLFRWFMLMPADSGVRLQIHTWKPCWRQELCKNEAKASWVPPADRLQYRHTLLLRIFKQFCRIVFFLPRLENRLFFLYRTMVSSCSRRSLFDHPRWSEGSSYLAASLILVRESRTPAVCFLQILSSTNLLGSFFQFPFSIQLLAFVLVLRPSCSILLFHPSEAFLMT